MIKSDLLTIWPRAFDFPIWRSLVSQHKDLFNNIIVVCTHNSVHDDLREFYAQQLPFIRFISPPLGSTAPNWYDEAVNIGLKYLKSEWVLFLEQDFWFRDNFLEELFDKTERLNFSCLDQAGRYHLACFLARTSLIDKTLKYFAPIKDKMDCFDLFTAEMIALSEGNYKTFEQLDFENGKDYFHLNALTQNMFLLEIGQEPNYHPEEFKKYLKKCLNLEIPLHPRFVELAGGYV